MTLDALAIAAHPDDAEIALGGTLARMASAGRSIGVLDLTRGECATRGTPERRAAEAEAAARVLGLAWRGNLGLADARLEVDTGAAERLARELRVHAPRVLFAPLPRDLHPDHVAAGELARRAWFLAGLARLARPGEAARRPARLYHYYLGQALEPTFVVDVGTSYATKLCAIRCFGSQLEPAGPEDRGEHLVHRLPLLARVEASARFFGALVGVELGEPLVHFGALPFEDPLLASDSR